MNKNSVEIERKFLVIQEKLPMPNLKESIQIEQGYLTKNDKGSVRIRIESNGGVEKAYLMSKTKIGLYSDDPMRNYESVDEIDVINAKIMMGNFTPHHIRKVRNIYYVGGKKWEVDFFQEPYLMRDKWLAEIELQSADEEFEMPEWVGREVTGEPEYYNANM